MNINWKHETIVILIGLGLMLLGAMSEAATFEKGEWDGGKSYVVLRGEIIEGDADKLKYHMEGVDVVVLESPGGVADEGWKMAEMIRKAKLDTFVYSECASACSYAFMGGIHRAMTEDAKIGYHPFHFSTVPSDWTINQIADYSQTKAVGTITKFAALVDTGMEWPVVKFLNTVYSTTSYEDMYWADYKELMEAGIVKYEN